MALVVGGMAIAMFSACQRSNNKNSELEASPSIVQIDTEEIQPECLGNTADLHRADAKIHGRGGQGLALQTVGLTLTAIDAAVQHDAVYSVTSLATEELPPLPQGMINMTASTGGYRLLPGGEHFSPYAELRITYDPERLPQGYTPDDIYTSFYDTSSLAWVRLERVEVDTINHGIVSLTTHFTDFINELLKAPEMPETQAFVPSVMSDLEAVSPMEGLTMIHQHRAHVTILYHRFLDQMTHAQGASQQLLFPEVISLSPDEMVLIGQIAEELRTIGFELEQLSPDSYSIQGVPSQIAAQSPVPVLQQILSRVRERSADTHAEWCEQIALSLAQSAAIPMGKSLNEKEMRELVSSLMQLPNHRITPDGKTVLALLTNEEIEKKF